LAEFGPAGNGKRNKYGTGVNPKVSIILPVYNTSGYLQACLDSVLAQTHCDIEVICVDDCSTDTSPKILESYAQRDSRIRIVSHGLNKGLPATRNTGMSYVTGQYVRHVDSDDVIPVESTKHLLDVARKYGSEIVIGNADRIVGKDVVAGDWLRRYMEPRHNIRLQDDAGMWRSFGDVWLYMFRRDFIDRSGLRFNEDVQFGEDQIYVSAALSAAEDISYCNSIVYFYRERSGSMTAKFSLEKVKDELTWPNIVKENLASHPDIYLYNLLSASVYRFFILDYAIRNYDKVSAFELIEKARLIYQDVSIEKFYSQEAERAYSLLNGFTLHFIVLLKVAPSESIYDFVISERYRRLPSEKKELSGTRLARLRKYLSKYINRG